MSATTESELQQWVYVPFFCSLFCFVFKISQRHTTAYLKHDHQILGNLGPSFFYRSTQYETSSSLASIFTEVQTKIGGTVTVWLAAWGQFVETKERWMLDCYLSLPTQCNWVMALMTNQFIPRISNILVIEFIQSNPPSCPW